MLMMKGFWISMLVLAVLLPSLAAGEQYSFEIGNQIVVFQTNESEKFDVTSSLDDDGSSIYTIANDEQDLVIGTVELGGWWWMPRLVLDVNLMLSVYLTMAENGLDEIGVKFAPYGSDGNRGVLAQGFNATSDKLMYLGAYLAEEETLLVVMCEADKGVYPQQYYEVLNSIKLT